MRAIVGYAFTGPEVRVGKEILFSNQIAKHSTLLGYTYLYRIYPKVTDSHDDSLGTSAKIAAVAMAGGRLGTIIGPMGIFTFASLGMAPFAIASAAVYGVSLVVHGFGSYYLTSEYCEAVLRADQRDFSA